MKKIFIDNNVRKFPLADYNIFAERLEAEYKKDHSHDVAYEIALGWVGNYQAKAIVFTYSSRLAQTNGQLTANIMFQLDHNGAWHNTKALYYHFGKRSPITSKLQPLYENLRAKLQVLFEEEIGRRFKDLKKYLEEPPCFYFG